MADTIPGLFNRQASRFGRRTLFLAKRVLCGAGVEFGEPPQRGYTALSWQQVAETVQALACTLLDGQVNAGDRILLLSENRAEWAIADLAIQSVGAWTVPVYHTLSAPDIAALCRDCRPALGIASSLAQAHKLAQALREAQLGSRVVVMDEASPPEPFMAWRSAVEAGRAARGRLGALLEQRLAGLRPEETATIIYTSGTTGEPKGVMLSHRNFLSNVEACRQVIPFSEDDVHLSFLPLSHVFERMGGWYLVMAVGGRIAYAESLESVSQNMREVRPTVMLGVPRFFEKLYASVQEGLRALPEPRRRLAAWAVRVAREATACTRDGRPLPAGLRVRRAAADWLVGRALRRTFGGRLRFFVSGGAPLSPEIGEFFYGLGITILEGYGLTETSPVIAVNRPPRPRFGSVGPLVPGVEVWVAEDGEILTRGPHVMQGYYQRPEETAEAIRDGWFHTGDIGRLDAEGYLYITDRKKDLIKTAGGKFVAPQKLENLLVTDPYISQAFVYGDREPYCVALIVPEAGALRRYAQEHGLGSDLDALVADPRIQTFYWQRVEDRQRELPRFERVKKIALVAQEFTQAAGELTPTLKAKRERIARRYDTLLHDLYQTSPA